MKQYFHKKVEKKWIRAWEREKPFCAPSAFSGKKKRYVLDMFPYPSAHGLHVGHVESYTASDILARYYRMCGFAVLHPMGWDAFGLPAENAAIKAKTHPKKVVKENVANFKRQLLSLGFSYDWSREVNTTDPHYYRWTQWIFLKLFNRGLAYQKETPVNWCPSCKTVLADEEVVGGACDRCHTHVERKSARQWMLRITAYADRLLSDLDLIDWPQHIKTMQRNWIGRSEGAHIVFPIADASQKGNKHLDTATVFTTRADTIFGATYLVLAPEYEALQAWKRVISNWKEVSAYISAAKNKSDEDRISSKEKTGVLVKGVEAINPANGKRVPIFVADYVVAHYGTGAIMAVPAHDQRDFDFAKKYNLSIVPVVSPHADALISLPYLGDGILINSASFNGQKNSLAARAIVEKLKGTPTVNYKMRDWVFARQRYWGEPTPVVFCEACEKRLKTLSKKPRALSQGEWINPGWVPVPQKDLPVTLPNVKQYEPTGALESPLVNVPSWVKTKCPRCKGTARRETNTMPQWAGSCWYYLRYLDPHNKKALVASAKEKQWMPVDVYIGGVEHAVLHLLYARFWHKVLYDEKVVHTKEPFYRLINQGIILGADGEKMSKSRGNIVNPDDIVERYGADALRMYEMFMGPLEDVKPWDEKGIVGVVRFLERVWAIGQRASFSSKKPSRQRLMRLHQTIKKVTEDVEKVRFNTAISALMILSRDMGGEDISQSEYETLLKLLSPFAPFITEEIWRSVLSHKQSISREKWPSYASAYIVKQTVVIAVQINGKTKGTLEVSAGSDKDIVVAEVKNNARLKGMISSLSIKKIIFVPDRILNIVA